MIDVGVVHLRGQCRLCVARGKLVLRVFACGGCDVLIHEVSSIEWLRSRPATFQTFAAKFHTTTAQLAELAARAKPRLLILYHVQAASTEQVVNEMAGRYSGLVVVGQDLDIY